MNFKRMLKFTSCGLLLAGCFLAYADSEVTLKDGTPISWDAFVDGLNNPQTVVGDTAIVPKTDAAAISYAAAEAKLKKAQGDTVAPYENIGLAKDTIGIREAAAKRAKTSLDSVAGITAEKKKAYEDAQTQLDSWNSQMSDLNNTLTQLTGQSQSLSAQLDDARDELSDLQDQLNSLSKTTKTETNTTYPTWLSTLYKDAQAYQKSWNAYLTGKEYTDLPLYYQITKTGSTSRTRYSIIIAFAKPNIYDETKDWRTASSMADFENALYPTDVNNGNGIVFTTTDVYLGENLTNLNEESVDPTRSFAPPTNDDFIINYAVNDIKELTQTTGYYSTTTTSTDVYDDENKAKKLEGQISDKKADIEEIRSNRSKVTTNINNTNASMTSLQEEIDGYTKPTKNEAGEEVPSEQSRLKKEWDDAVSAEVPFQTAYDNATDAVTAANQALANAQSAFNTAKGNVATAEDGVETAMISLQAAANRIAQENYQANFNQITLTANVTASSPINNFTGTIIGKNNPIITVTDGALFTTFGGALANVAINGTTFEVNNNGRFTNVVRWNGTNGVVYNDANAQESYNNFDAFAFAIRDNYGVAFDANKWSIATKDANNTNIAYKLTAYNAIGVTPTTEYVLIAEDGNMTEIASNTSSASFALAANRFAQSATDDIKGRGVANVFYGDNNDCDVVEITDGKTTNAQGVSTYADFYAPADINAATVNYTRQYSAGYNTVMLPFAIKADYNSNGNISALCTYDRETLEKFYFTQVADEIPANTPLLLVGKDGVDNFTLDDLTNVTIQKTTSQIINGKKAEDGSFSSGTFKPAMRGEFGGEYDSYKVYGYSVGKSEFQAAGAQAVFPPFRMVITSELVQTEANRAPRRIAILDSKGIEITDVITGVKGVAAEELAFDVRGGQGELIFTADSNYGEVPVYDMDGRMITLVNVVEGTTSANVQKGLYIVMGKKVMVK